ncbi:unnamed protein product [Leptosia nina]|uniref:Uncharacterized protein n=1 Tax=Leptosia nina TaxID=320188 RepID=A0AAV1J771_9NEOP
MAESKENGEFDDSLKLIKQALWVCGIDLFETEQSIRIDNRFLFYITFVWLYYDVCGEIYCLYDFALSGKSVQEISLIAPFPFVCAMGTSKAACVYFHKDVALRVLRKLRDLHPKNDATFEVKTKEETMKLLSKFKILMCFGLSGAAILFDIAPFIAMGIDYYEIGHTQLKLPYLVKFFYDPYGMYVWPFEFVHQVGSCK